MSSIRRAVFMDQPWRSTLASAGLVGRPQSRVGGLGEAPTSSWRVGHADAGWLGLRVLPVCARKSLRMFIVASIPGLVNSFWA